MSFRPNVHDELTLNGVTYRIAEHPAAPGIPYGQEGRAGIVYQLLPADRSAGFQPAALKVFRARFRTPALVSQAEKLAAFADLPGLTVCRRTVLTPQRNADLLRREPDLTYAVLMPWIEGPTWVEVMLEKRPLTPQQALDLARAFADILSRMEQNGIAHCDLSGPNVLLPMLAQPTADRRPQTAYSPSSTVELVDVEGLYAPGLSRPEALPSGSSGYAHRTAREGLWGPTADRFAGAVLLAEMLGWGDESVREACYGETYFDPAEMPAQGSANPSRYQTLLSALARHYGQPVADLFERAWTSETLADCPTFGEWLVALPESVSSVQSSVFSDQSSEGSEQTGDQESSITAIRALMQAAWRLEEQNKLESALEVYRQALELAGADPSLRSLAREIELTIQDVQARARPISPRIEESLAERAISLPVEEVKVALPAEEEPGIREEPYRKRPWGWVLGGLVVFALLAALVYGVNVQQQRAAQATAMAIAWQQATATAQAQAAATAWAQAGRIAFASKRDGNWEIYVMNTDGSGQINLTNNPADDRWPSWSPDGKRIAFASNRDGNWEIYVMNADGSGVTRLTNNPGGNFDPSWSPDGRHIAFSSRRDVSLEIYVMNADGSGVTRLTNNPAEDAEASWSPDGKRIAFVSNRDGNWEIYVMNADGSGQINLTNNPAEDDLPSWSPDGRRIAFASNRDGNWEIYVMNADGSGVTRLTNNPADDGWPSWSPDGKRIAFISERDGNQEIHVMNADGSEVTRLTSNSAEDRYPSWSPAP
jgi:Tol biopolymer transport system component